MIKHRYEFIADLSKVHYLKLLRDLTLSFSKYYLEAINYPTPYALAKERYKAIVCHDIDSNYGEDWSIALIFKLGREKKAIWHTVAKVDYILINPGSRATFGRVSNVVRALYQYVLKTSKASVDDVLIRLDSQLNPAIAKKLEDILITEDFKRMSKEGSWAKRIRSINPKSGKNEASIPLPTAGRSSFVGMRPMVQSTIRPLSVKESSDTIRFIGRIKKGSKQHKAILSFCRRHPDWATPNLKERLTYMQSLFTGDHGDIERYVNSLIEDAHFIIGLDGKGRVSSFMAFVVGYSAPSIFDDNEYIAADRIVFVPIIMCDTVVRGSDSHWSKAGFQQALLFYKMLINILRLRENAGKFSIIGAMSTSDSLYSRLLDAIGFGKKSDFSNAPAHRFTTDFYSLRLD